MPQITKPESKYLNLSEYRQAMKKANKESDFLFTILEPATEKGNNGQYLEIKANNELMGDKILYDFKNKFNSLINAHGTNTDDWVGTMIKPILPDNSETIFFVTFESIASTSEDIAEWQHQEN